MTANELANALKCEIMRHGDRKVLIDGREVERVVHLGEWVYIQIKGDKKHV